MTRTALVPIADGSEEIEVVCIVDTLRRGGVTVTVASVMDDLQITASRQTRIVADVRIADCAGLTYDLIALPGGMPGAEHLRDNAELTALLVAQHDAGRLIGALCASPAVVLLPHGLLDGHRATCFPSFLPLLQAAPNVVALEDRVVDDGMLITSRGPGTAIEFALALVARLYTAEQAAEISARMLAK
ncbi:MAG: DJ-1/PfpI family protein [Anaerolineae bacterium]|nr:DJ-1/PfpI family protein [Anaerolineae bacterium]